MKKHIVVIGGGAGGLVLVTRLAKKIGKFANVTLVDQSLTHIWKPLLHEVAAGSMNSYEDEINYLSHSSKHGYNFHFGSLEKVDIAQQTVVLAPIVDDAGTPSIPQRHIPFDILVLALGSISNDFGTEGVAEHCLFLDSRPQADRFQQAFLGAYLRAHEAKLVKSDRAILNIAIVGAGATGVELAAELRSASTLLGKYGLKEINPEDVKISILEAAPDILNGQSETLVSAAKKQLAAMDIDVLVNTKVVKVTENTIETADGRIIEATLKVWCAGIKASSVLQESDNLETNKINQILVRPTLQVKSYDNIFALGDCTDLRLNDIKIPPRAQSAYQQAIFLVKNIQHLLQQSELEEFYYNDQGAFISFSDQHTSGVLMGKLLGNRMLEGFAARIIYILLYRKHQMAIHGVGKTVVLIIKDFIIRGLGPRLKLH